MIAKNRGVSRGLLPYLQLLEDIEGHVEVIVLDADVHEAGVGVHVAVDASLPHLPQQLHCKVHLAQPTAQGYGCTKQTG